MQPVRHIQTELLSKKVAVWKGKARPVSRAFGYSLSGFKLSSNQERPINSHFLEQNVCPSRARLVLLRYWE